MSDMPTTCDNCAHLISQERGLGIEYDIPVLCGGSIMVYPGDVVFRDRDGVVVIRIN